MSMPRLTRRTVLRGAGAALALPWLEAMQAAFAQWFDHHRNRASDSPGGAVLSQRLSPGSLDSRANRPRLEAHAAVGTARRTAGRRVGHLRPLAPGHEHRRRTLC